MMKSNPLHSDEHSETLSEDIFARAAKLKPGKSSIRPGDCRLEPEPYLGATGSEGNHHV